MAINYRFKLAILTLGLLFISVLPIFLYLGERFFHVGSEQLFWYLSVLLSTLYVILVILAKAFHGFYETKLEAIDNSAKETLHELSTPIATIQANCELLKHTITQSKDTQRIERISKASKRLMELYEELEWTIKNDSGIQPKTKVMTDELIDDLVISFEEKSKEKNITVETHLEPELINIDYFGLKKTISNLLDNAIKYADNNSRITVLWKDKSLCVTNTGDEIKAEELLSVFDIYYRGETKQKGYGIGLHAIKSFCDKNGINVKINSQNRVTIVELCFTGF